MLILCVSWDSTDVNIVFFYSDRDTRLGCYTHNVSVIVPFDHLQVYVVVLGGLLESLNRTVYSIYFNTHRSYVTLYHLFI